MEDKIGLSEEGPEGRTHGYLIQCIYGIRGGECMTAG